MTETPLLEIKDLHAGFRSDRTTVVPAVVGANLTVYSGQTVAIVGESGSGKSTVAHAIIDLLPGRGVVTGGQILFEGHEITQADKGVDPRSARFVDRARPSGPDVESQPVVEGRHADQGGAGRQRGGQGQGGRRSRRGAARGGRSARRRAPRPAVSPRVLRRHAPARTHRHGSGGATQAAHRGRADVGARRHGAEADPRPSRQAHRPPRRGGALHHPRSRPRCRARRPPGRHVQGCGRRVRAGPRRAEGAAAPLHRATGRLGAVAGVAPAHLGPRGGA